MLLAIVALSTHRWALAAIGPEGLVAHVAGPVSLEPHAGPDVLSTVRIVSGAVRGSIDLLLVVVDDEDPETTSLLLQLHHGDALRVVGVASVTSAEVLHAIGLCSEGHERAPYGDPVLVRAVTRAAEVPLADTQVAEAWAVAALYASRDQRFLTSPLLDWGTRLPEPAVRSRRPPGEVESAGAVDDSPAPPPTSNRRCSSRRQHGARSPGDLLSVKLAADRLGLSRDTVYRLIDEGEIAHHLVRGVRRVAVTDIEEYLARMRVPSTHEVARGRRQVIRTLRGGSSEAAGQAAARELGLVPDRSRGGP